MCYRALRFLHFECAFQQSSLLFPKTSHFLWETLRLIFVNLTYGFLFFFRIGYLKDVSRRDAYKSFVVGECSADLELPSLVMKMCNYFYPTGNVFPSKNWGVQMKFPRWIFPVFRRLLSSMLESVKKWFAFFTYKKKRYDFQRIMRGAEDIQRPAEQGICRI